MYSSNQIITVTCDSKQLELVIEFFIQMIEYSVNENGRLIYQTTDDGRFAVGWSFKDEVPKGWEKFISQHPSNELIAAMLRCYMKGFAPDSTVPFDGDVEPGFRFDAAPICKEESCEGIMNPYNAIFVVKSILNYYSK